MTQEEVRNAAIARAQEIIRRDAVELALSSRDLDEEAISANTTILAAQIAKALIEFWEDGHAESGG